jgi:hypothetical protein
MNIYRRKEVRRRNKEKNKQNEKDNTRKWHIFVLTGRFFVVLSSKSAC